MTEAIWNGYKSIDFDFEGHKATLVFPKNANKSRHWLLKTEYLEAFPEFEIEMLKRGWHLAFINNVTRWCLDEDLDRKARFAEYLISEYGLYPKCVPVGLSCGGLIATKFAARHPNLVSALYLDAPVMNLISVPGGVGDADQKIMKDFIAEFTAATGITFKQLMHYRENPIDKLQTLLDNRLPIVLVYGDSDTVVPYDENGAILESFYKKAGGTILAIGKPGCAHHPHGLADNTPIIEFVEKYAD